MDNPRKRLEKLMEGLSLPDGFRLTPAREGMLRALGMTMLKTGNLTCYGQYLTTRRLAQRYSIKWDNKAKAAFRGMAKAGWIKIGDLNGDGVAGYWRERPVVFQDGLAQLAKRLGARQVLWEERRSAVILRASEAHDEVARRLYAARSILNKTVFVSATSSSDNDVLSAIRGVRALTTELSEAERELERARESVARIPEPTEEEAFTWLMQRELERSRE